MGFMRIPRRLISRHGWNHGRGGADEIPGLFEMVPGTSGRDSETPQTGDLLVGSSSPPGFGLFSVGTNDYVLTADSTQTMGMKWAQSGAVLNYNKSGASTPYEVKSHSDANVTSGYAGGDQSLLSLVEIDDTSHSNGKWAVIRIGQQGDPLSYQMLFDPFFNGIVASFGIGLLVTDASDYSDPNGTFWNARQSGFDASGFTGLANQSPADGVGNDSPTLRLGIAYNPTGATGVQAKEMHIIVKVDDPDTGKYHVEIQLPTPTSVFEIDQAGVLKYPNAPTAAAGLTTGQIWQDPAAAHVLKWVP